MRGRKFLFDNSFDEAAQNRLKAEADARARREAEARPTRRRLLPSKNWRRPRRRPTSKVAKMA